LRIPCQSFEIFEYSFRFSVFLQEILFLEILFYFQNFNIVTNNLISVETAKVTMVLVRVDLSRTVMGT
jgi:hypothetical protein